MKIGDSVHLSQPFKPTVESGREYHFGIIAGLIPNTLSAPDTRKITEILLYLYDPDTATTYTDNHGEQAMYSFSPEEIDLSQ